MSEGALLINGVHLGDPARSLQHPVALPEVPPPHVLVGDFDDVSHREPALLSIRQADALVHALGEGGQREDLRSYWSCKICGNVKLGGCRV